MPQMCSEEGRRCQEERAALKKSVTGIPFAQIGIDISGPYKASSSGNKYIMMVSAYFHQMG